MRLAKLTLATASLALLAACTHSQVDIGPTETVLPLNQAWFEGRKVGYVTTDISDAAMAQAAGVNFVPRLANAITRGPAKSILERVYKFPQGEQISIFQSAPNPTGAANTDQSYSPVWRLVTVHWLKPAKVRELKSEEEVLAAEEAGDLAVKVTDIVVNCPVVQGPDGQRLKGGR